MNTLQVKSTFARRRKIIEPQSSGFWRGLTSPPKTFEAGFLVANVVHARFRIARDPTTAAAIADPYLGQSIGPVPGYGVS